MSSSFVFSGFGAMSGFTPPVLPACYLIVWNHASLMCTVEINELSQYLLVCEILVDYEEAGFNHMWSGDLLKT